MAESKRQKTIVIGAGPVGTLAALYAAQRGHDVEIYDLRSGTFHKFSLRPLFLAADPSLERQPVKCPWEPFFTRDHARFQIKVCGVWLHLQDIKMAVAIQSEPRFPYISL